MAWLGYVDINTCVELMLMLHAYGMCATKVGPSRDPCSSQLLIIITIITTCKSPHTPSTVQGPWGVS